MNLLISELAPMDVMLDRPVPWIDELESYLATMPAEPEAPEYADQPLPVRRTAWYELRLSTLRHFICGN